MTSFQGKVKGIIGCDCVQLINAATNEEVQVLLASLNVPRLDRRDESKSDSFSFEAREWMRILLVGRTIKCDLINENSGRKYCDITLLDEPFANFSVNEALVREGLATVHKSASKQTGSYFRRIVEAETEAKETGRMLHSNERCEQNEIRNSYYQVDVTSEFLEANKGVPVSAIVEGVQSPTLFRLTFPSRKREKPHLMVQCNLMGLSSNVQTFPELESVKEEAEQWLEANVHQRDVKFMPLAVNRANGQLGGILYTSKKTNLNYELASRGWVQILENAIRDEPSLTNLQDAVEKAQQERNGIFEGFSSAAQNALHTFEGSLIEVVNGECLIVSEHDSYTPVEEGNIHRIYLSSIRAPRVGSANREADPLANEAKDLLNKLTQDKRLKVRVEFKKKTPEGLLKANISGPGGIAEEMDCGSVFVNGKNVALELLRQGLVSVPYVSQNNSNEKGFDHNLYIKVESEAKAANVRPVSNTANLRLADITGKDASMAKSKQYEGILTRVKKLEGVITYVYNPGRFKVKFTSERLVANVVLSNLKPSQGPRPAMRGNPATEGDPMHTQALIYAKSRLLNRNVRFVIMQCDRGGNFLAQCFIGTEDFSDTLIKKGYATIAYDDVATQNQLDLQEMARQNQIGMWSSEAFRNSKVDVVVEDPATTTTVEPTTMNAVSVVHVNSVNDFYLIEDTEAADASLNSLQNKLQEYAANCSRGSVDLKVNQLYLAIFREDNFWYRAKVISVDRKEKTANVLFIDFGNTDQVSFNSVIAMPSQFDTKVIPQFSRQYSLVGVVNKSDFTEEAATVLFNLTQDPPYSCTIYQTRGIPSVVLKKDGVSESINAQLLSSGTAVLSKKRIPANLPQQEIDSLTNASRVASTSNSGMYRFVRGRINSDDSDSA